MAAASVNIRILPPEEARKIAAGEVIDRPAALIREFLDNAIDANATAIDASIEEGGIKKVEVADNGSGMNREDLLICFHDHATSKIRSLDDLNSAETLGFRGEALAAASAVARLEIVSAVSNNDAWRLRVGPGNTYPPHIEAANRTRGCTVSALNLYDTIPARKRFLKRESSEAALCRQIFIEKALAFVETVFRFSQDGQLKIFLPAAASKKERFAAALTELVSSFRPTQAQFLHEIHVSGEGFSADIVMGGPELYRNDRRMLFVFANGRRIQDYSLITAMEYGTQGLFPNGTHPLGAVFIDIDPALADFNVHPAKREARFRDPGAIHHAITAGLRNYFNNDRSNLQFEAQRTQDHVVNYLEFEHMKNLTHEAQYEISESASVNFLNLHEKFSQINSAAAETAPVYGEPRYAGKIFGVFLLIEWGDKLFIIDQHAAHERILYNRFLESPIPRQELLIPISFNTESPSDDDFLELKKEELAAIAIVIERDGTGWRIDALPENWQLGDRETVNEILALRTAGENIGERWAATISCHHAIKDGDYIDDAAAIALAKEALDLPDPRCPHGRPIWTELTRDALYKAVRRT